MHVVMIYVYTDEGMCININFHVTYSIFVPQSIRFFSCTLKVSCKIYVERQPKDDDQPMGCQFRIAICMVCIGSPELRT